MNDDLVSIIIPCFNTGIYLLEALESINLSTYKIYEIIIINDGSTDLNTLDILNSIQDEKIFVLNQNNKGPAAARNHGVRFSKGNYIFFLDSDNKVKKDYLQKAFTILNINKDIGVVYANPNFFGDSIEPRFYTDQFNIDKMLLGNYIDLCSMIRRSVWNDVDGFDEKFPGCEDWDFWLKVYKKGWGFHHINEVLFDYRIRNNSLTTKVDSGPIKDISKLISINHNDIIYERFKFYYKLLKLFRKKPLSFFYQIIIKKN